MGKVENNQNYSELFGELKTLNTQYKILLAEIAARGIETAKDSARQWSSEKIESIEQKMEEISEKAEQVAGKIKNAGEIALGLGILGVEAGVRGTKLAIKGAKTLHSKFKIKVNNAKTHIISKKNYAKDWVEDKVDDAKEWVEDKAEDIKTVGKFIKGDIINKKDKVIKGVKTLPSNLKSKINRAQLKATMYQVGLKREAREKIEQGKEAVKDFIDDKKEQVEEWVDNKKEIYEATKYAVKQTVVEKKEKIVTETKAKAEEFIDKTQEAKLRFEQRKNKTLLGAIKNVRNIATALEGKLEERILSDKEKAEKVEQRQPQKAQKKEMGLEME